MDSSEIISGIKKKAPGFNALAVLCDYADEVRIKVAPGQFREACLALHAMLVSPVAMFFAEDRRSQENVYVIRCVFGNFRQGQWVTVSTDIPPENPRFDSLVKNIHSAALFERKIWEMFGIKPEGNPDLRRLHLHDEVWPQGAFPLRKDFSAPVAGALGEYEFGRVEGEGIFEVPVGPVHAGIIGPGHFRFSVAGEPIINLELRLGFTHRGVEKLFEGRQYSQAIGLSECVAGDSAFAHSLAFAQAAEKIAGVQVTGRAAFLRAICLELERMYNHAQGIGGMAIDVGFSFPGAYASLIKEAILKLNEKITGSRYLKNFNAVGGVLRDFDQAAMHTVRESLKNIHRDFNEMLKILYASVSFMDRVETTGVLRRKTAEDLGVWGLAGRASGVPVDLRKHFAGVYRQAKFKMETQESGDALARLNIRAAEFEESCRLIEEFMSLRNADEDILHKPELKAGSAIGYAEGWRGPVLYWLTVDEAGSIMRCAIVDASFRNWQGLSYAVLGNIIPDFPLCNKSFDLSYPGCDL